MEKCKVGFLKFKSFFNFLKTHKRLIKHNFFITLEVLFSLFIIYLILISF